MEKENKNQAILWLTFMSSNKNDGDCTCYLYLENYLRAFTVTRLIDDTRMKYGGSHFGAAVFGFGWRVIHKSKAWSSQA